MGGGICRRRRRRRRRRATGWGPRAPCVNGVARLGSPALSFSCYMKQRALPGPSFLRESTAAVQYRSAFAARTTCNFIGQMHYSTSTGFPARQASATKGLNYLALHASSPLSVLSYNPPSLDLFSARTPFPKSECPRATIPAVNTGSRSRAVIPAATGQPRCP